MKKRMRSVLITFMLLATLFLVTACAGDTSPFGNYDADGFNISVVYDANGGQFDTGVTQIIDSYDTSKLEKNSAGNYELGLLAPDAEVRKIKKAERLGYFLAGWYTERTESKDSNGNTVYTYAGLWDFEKDLYEVSASENHTSAEPVVTLYAAWVPEFKINFVDRKDGSEIGTYTYNPLNVKEIKVPEWNEDGEMEMYKFPVKAGYTFEAAYYDAEGKNLIEGTVTHTGAVDMATGTASNHEMTVYVDSMKGEWFQIYNIKQLQDNARPAGSYVLHADLDFADTYWPATFMNNNFSGTIIGNGHTISNVKINQTDSSRTMAGLFGSLTETASISDLTFENITFTIKKGSMKAGTTYGLLAGTASSKSVLSNVKILTSKIVVDAKDVYFGTEDYAIGKVFGAGFSNQVEFTGIVCEAINNENERITIVEDHNQIELIFKD